MERVSDGLADSDLLLGVRIAAEDLEVALVADRLLLDALRGFPNAPLGGLGNDDDLLHFDVRRCILCDDRSLDWRSDGRSLFMARVRVGEDDRAAENCRACENRNDCNELDHVVCRLHPRIRARHGHLRQIHLSPSLSTRAQMGYQRTYPVSFACGGSPKNRALEALSVR